ncbi:MAG: hypothetical protein IKF38_01100 [Clostridia bacterium]|nr:hypothetical protein [Clostridia bacterium]
MIAFVNLNSAKKGEVNKFLSKFYNNNFNLEENNWEKKFSNPIEIAELIGAYIDNVDDYELSLWLSLDEGVIVKVDTSNANDIIKYLYERFPY